MVSVKPLIVHWHQDSAPIYGACFQPHEKDPVANRTTRLVTAGGDNNARVWRLRLGAGAEEIPRVEYCATLAKHERAVNAVQFDPSGQILATASDDGVVCLWTLSEASAAASQASTAGGAGGSGGEAYQPFGADYEDAEVWRLLRKCRTASFGEIYDLAWSPSGAHLAATSMDKTVSVLDCATGACVAALRDHRHYVQGVAWDPKDEFLATQSSDQRVLIYPLKYDASHKLLGVSAPTVRLDKTELGDQRVVSFHPESFSSFFRRLAFSPDGQLLVVPASQIDQVAEPSRAEEARPDTAPLASALSADGAQPDDTRMDVDEPAAAAVKSEESGPAATASGAAAVVPSARAQTPVSQDCGSTPVVRYDAASGAPPVDLPSSPPPEAAASAAAGVSAGAPQAEASTDRADSRVNCALVYARNELNRPAAILPLPRPCTVVRFCPVLFKRRGEPAGGAAVELPYRMVYAVATLTGIFIYDTESTVPMGMASNLHYSTITDLAWSPDGRLLLVTSIDGFCSAFRFAKGELGDPAGVEAHAVKHEAAEPPAALLQPRPQLPINTLTVRRKPKPAAVAGSQSADSQSADSQSANSQSANSQSANSQSANSQSAILQDANSQSFNSQSANSQITNSQGANSQSANSQSANSQSVKSQDANSQSAQLQDGSSQNAGSQSGGPESMEVSAGPQDSAHLGTATRSGEPQSASMQNADSPGARLPSQDLQSTQNMETLIDAPQGTAPQSAGQPSASPQSASPQS